MVTEDYVSFETAKLLKEKKFDEPCIYVYCHDGSEDIWDADKEDVACQKPTLQMAMKWLRKVHGIYPDIAVEELDDNTTFFRVDGIYLKQKKMWDKYNNLFKTYEEACEAAIKYCLENLI